MKHDLQAFIMKYMGEGISDGLSEKDKLMTISSMGFGQEASSAMFKDMFGLEDSAFHVEIEEAVLLGISKQIAQSILESLGSKNLSDLRRLLYERNCELVGEEAADVIRCRDEEVANILAKNLTKLMDDAEFRASVASRCHLRIVN